MERNKSLCALAMLVAVGAVATVPSQASAGESEPAPLSFKRRSRPATRAGGARAPG